MEKMDWAILAINLTENCRYKAAEKELDMNIYACVGSSCHLKGSYDIINLMREALKEHGLEDKVTLSAAFCLGKCTDGVTIKIDDKIISGVSKENFSYIFSKYVLKEI